MSDEDTYEIPLQDQRVFGAGIKRKRVKFVPSSASSPTTPATATTPVRSVSDLYLSLVLPKEALSTQGNTQASTTTISPSPPTVSAAAPNAPTVASSDPEVCEICSLPLSSTDTAVALVAEEPVAELTDTASFHPPPKPQPHEASLAHQVCLAHSHPPSHLDRRRKGLAYLAAYGWDPDSQRGLGAEGQGMRFPIKTKPKDDKLGIGVVLPKAGEIARREKADKLDAGRVRKLQDRDRRRGERLREIFYRSEDVERYLGGG